MNGPEREKQEEEQWQVDPLHGDVLFIFYWKLREDIMQVVESDVDLKEAKSTVVRVKTSKKTRLPTREVTEDFI